MAADDKSNEKVPEAPFSGAVGANQLVTATEHGSVFAEGGYAKIFCFFVNYKRNQFWAVHLNSHLNGDCIIEEGLLADHCLKLASMISL